MTIDTNILISYLKGEVKIRIVLDDWKESNRPLFISSISVAEILALPNLSSHEINQIKQFLGEFLSLPFNNEIAEISALIQRKYHLKLPDAAIAATALSRHTPLATRDKQFQKIKELVVVPM
jgi:predicted nucleic acid-binding protein